ncbi:unnamed protein product, partial [Ectocarpus sp. 13 AM-2016]
ASQTLLSRVARAALLVVVPDPVTCFENSSFRQVGVGWIASRSDSLKNFCRP